MFLPTLNVLRQLEQRPLGRLEQKIRSTDCNNNNGLVQSPATTKRSPIGKAEEKNMNLD